MVRLAGVRVFIGGKVSELLGYDLNQPMKIQVCVAGLAWLGGGMVVGRRRGSSVLLIVGFRSKICKASRNLNLRLSEMWPMISVELIIEFRQGFLLWTLIE